jgi:ferric-dicitrate binding protein FerR (iron transport regulator)
MQTLTDLWKPSTPDYRAEAEDAFNKHLSRIQQIDASFDVHGLYPEAGSFPESASKNKRKKVLIISSLSAVLLAGLVWYAGSFSKPSSLNTADQSPKTSSVISTHNGSKTNVVLPDGTQVWLNAGSELIYDKQYGNTIREVNLKGEAFFDVIKNKEKPFVIHTGKINIRVLGTAFNVKSYPGERTIETSLIRGSIEVTFKDRPAEKVILKPNEKLVVANEDAPTINPQKQSVKKINEPIVAIGHLNYAKIDSTVIETAWVQNRLVFQDESFQELSRRMERWYGVTIKFNDPQVEALHFTGSFDTETIQQALKALQVSAHFNYSFHSNEISISR